MSRSTSGGRTGPVGDAGPSRPASWWTRLLKVLSGKRHDDRLQELIDELANVITDAEGRPPGRGGARPAPEDRLTELLPRLEALLKTEPEPVRAQPGSPVPALLIEFRDRISANSGHLPSAEWIDRQLLKALRGMGVSTIEDDGAVDPRWHEVLEAQPTSDPEIDRHIAATVRPGYRTQNELIRPQQVIAWVVDE